MPTCTLFRIDPGASPIGLKKGGSVQLNPVGYDIQHSPQHGTVFTYASSDSTIASVTVAGVVSAVKAGTAVITVSSGGVNGSVNINVYN
jgi:hypothetical protein